MKLLALALLATTAAAGQPNQQLFTLQSSGSSNSSQNNLYLTPRHTAAEGPLNSKPVFQSDSTKADTFYVLNDTVRTDTPNGPYAIALEAVDGGKGPVRLGEYASTGSHGFKRTRDDKNDKVVASGNNWSNWIICDDAGIQGLFYVQNGNDAPDGCNKIDLKVNPKESS
ncbi:hypothetical protein N7492_002657 [Penicillium capsulatum]|uniref:DUF7907 domain-containing protein n=1 Tax=Penicillium capsulatum TaxID=69766 RepID=A0A9W9IKG8_9EURO|nr:hypothetical protein N7492_002657 [Penicillium capsulatum]KAJ6122743.1 hypothetical protein N7512_005208 [Penicillium capsulatum]